jgi:hypothetical protein
MKIGIALLMAGSIVATGGCYHPPYSYDVRGTGEGGVNITTVPYQEEPWRNPTPAPAPPPIIVYLPATAPTTESAPEAVAPTPPGPVTQPSDQQRIQALEAKVRELAAENDKLKQQLPATMPATNP